MSLKPEPIGPIPEETARLAKAVFPEGSTFIKMRDDAADAVRKMKCSWPCFRKRGNRHWLRGDWHWSRLCNLLKGYPIAKRLMPCVLIWIGSMLLALNEKTAALIFPCGSRVSLPAYRRQRGVAFESGYAPRAPDEWYERYEHRVEEYRLPTEQAKRMALAETIGADGYMLLGAIYSTPELNWLAHIPAVEILRRVWVQQFERLEGKPHLRANDTIPPPSKMICSPYDIEATYGRTRDHVVGRIQSAPDRKL